MWVMNAWMDTYGKVYPVNDYGHGDAARDEHKDAEWGDGLERKGWMHLSCNLRRFVSNGQGQTPTQAQIDSLWDIFTAGNALPTLSPKARFIMNELRTILHIG